MSAYQSSFRFLYDGNQFLEILCDISVPASIWRVTEDTTLDCLIFELKPVSQ